MKQFTPSVVEVGRHSYGLMLVELDICYLCKKTMVYPPPIRNYGHQTFPYYHIINFTTQLELAGWVEMSNEKVDDNSVCVECVQAGKLTILCALCKLNWPSNQAQEHFGDPPEYLCKTCYSTIPAQCWHETVKRLEESHKYDF